MGKRLIIMRHADSPQITQGRDFARPLSRKGAQQAEEMGKFLLKNQWVPDVILVSRARRTVQTATILAKSARMKEEQILEVEGLYNASADQIERVIRISEIPSGTNSIMVLAHNPGVSRFTMECCGPMTTLYFSPAGLAGFEMDDEIAWSDFSIKNTEHTFYQEPKNN